MKGYADLHVCQVCYEDTLLMVSAVDYYILQQHMKPLQNLPLEKQLNVEAVTTE